MGPNDYLGTSHHAPKQIPVDPIPHAKLVEFRRNPRSSAGSSSASKSIAIVTPPSKKPTINRVQYRKSYEGAVHREQGNVKKAQETKIFGKL